MRRPGRLQLASVQRLLAAIRVFVTVLLPLTLTTIEHLMIDVRRGASLTRFSRRGVPGYGDKLFCYPLGALAVDTSEEQFILDIDRKGARGRSRFRQGALAEHG